MNGPSRWRSSGDPGPPDVAFYCVSSSLYFLGAVALVNSLRLQGHREPIFVLDCGLTPRQREAISTQARVIPAPEGREPSVLKAELPLRHPAETMVLLDTDVIVTRPLAPLVERAAAGPLVAFRNNLDRFVPEWAELLDLGPLRRREYVCSGLVAVGSERAGRILPLLRDRQDRVDMGRSYFGSHDPDYPLLYGDQDVLNAILAAEPGDEDVVALDHRLAPMVPFEGLELHDERTLSCAYPDGTAPYAIHHALSPKPWQQPVYDGIYTHLLRRLLGGADVAVRLPGSEIPRWLRTGALASAHRRAARAGLRLGGRLGR